MPSRTTDGVLAVTNPYTADTLAVPKQSDASLPEGAGGMCWDFFAILIFFGTAMRNKNVVRSY